VCSDADFVCHVWLTPNPAIYPSYAYHHELGYVKIGGEVRPIEAFHKAVTHVSLTLQMVELLLDCVVEMSPKTPIYALLIGKRS
jgi:hypothetical protein